MRGAICFGLVLRLPSLNRVTGKVDETIQTSILSIVIITTVCFGFLTPILSRKLMPEVVRKREAKKLQEIEAQQEKLRRKKLKEQKKKRALEKQMEIQEQQEKDLSKQKRDLEEVIRSSLSQKPGSLFGQSIGIDPIQEDEKEDMGSFGQGEKKQDISVPSVDETDAQMTSKDG